MTIEQLQPPQKASLAPISLEDRYDLEQGHIYLNGIQALVRMPIEQARRDKASGLRTGTFISGYPGSPLGGYDLMLQRSRNVLERHGIIHRPGENEELAATTLIGTQLLDHYPHSRYDGVTGIWYGKGPGLDRAGDALRHGNFAGTSTHGAVVILSGEDHEAKSSTLPYEQEYAFAHAGIPVLYPASVDEFITYGLHAIAMSRYTGLWVALKLVGQLCDGGQTLELSPTAPQILVPHFEINGRQFRKKQDNMFFPGKTVETERHVFTERHPAAMAYLQANGIDRVLTAQTNATLGILTAGKSYADTVQALTDLGITDDDLNASGVRLIKLGCVYPVDTEFVRDAAAGLDQLIVVEEKRGTLEEKVKDAVCNLSSRPQVYGKRDAAGQVLFPEYGTMESDYIAEKLAPLLQSRVRHSLTLAQRISELATVDARDYTAPAAKRSPNYCSGCPHNVSTKLLDGQVAWGAPGCHIFAALMDDQPHKQIDATFPLGGEGVGWIGLQPFTDLEHVFQNQGDGSLFHSSYLNIRFSIAAGVTMTYKILFNGYVANTGAQSAVGAKDVPRLVQLLALEGVAKIAIIARDPAGYRNDSLPAVATVHDASEVDAVLADLASTEGVTIFLYDGECANERRRQQKRGKAPKPTRFVVINEDVCENCGDCGEVTNCMSLHKADTEFGPKTRIHQSSCNQDTSCLKGDCPSFLTVDSSVGLAKPSPAILEAADLADPSLPALDHPYNVYIPGVGGTGVLTVNSLLCWAAMLDGHEVMSYDQTGSAQKWGAVLSSLVISPAGQHSAANKVGRAHADLYLAVDVMAGADKVNLDRCAPDRTAALINTGLLPSGEMIRDVAFDVDVATLIEPITRFTDPRRSVTVDAKVIAETLFGDYMATNLVALGTAYQAGLLPISGESIESAIRVNGTAVQQSVQAFRYGRLAYLDPQRVHALIAPPPADAHTEQVTRRAALPRADRGAYDDLLSRSAHLDDESRRLLAVRVAELILYQNRQYASQYLDFVLDIADREADKLDSPAELPVTREVIRYLYKLMAYKDEYEVARLHLRTAREQKVAAMFAETLKIRYNLHPPMLRALGMSQKLSVSEHLLNPAFRTLVAMRGVRGRRFDPFGRDRVRREERRLIGWYRDLVTTSMTQLSKDNHETVVALATIPDMIRGYENIKLNNIAAAQQQALVLQGQLNHRKSLPLFTIVKEN